MRARRKYAFTLLLAVVVMVVINFLALAGDVAAQARSKTATPAVRDIFPWFAYVHSGGKQDIQLAAEKWGIPTNQYMDRVCADLSAHNFNVIWLNNLDFAILPEWLTAAKRHGLRVIAQGGEAYYPDPWDEEWSHMPSVRKVRSFWRRALQGYRNDQTVLLYVISEEPPPKQWIFKNLKKIIGPTQGLDPTKPMISEYNWVESARLAVKALTPKVVVFGRSPFGSSGDSDDQRRSFFPLITEQSYKAARSVGAPLWALEGAADLDIYQDGRLVERKGGRPTPTQLRWDVWSALLHGAKGIGYFDYTWFYDTPKKGRHEVLSGLVTKDGRPTETYEAAAAVSRDLDPLKELLLRIEPANPLSDNSVYWQSNDQVRSRIFVNPQSGERYLMVVNYDWNAAHSVEVPAGLGPVALTDLRTGRDLMSNAVGEISLAPGDGTLFKIGA